MKVKICEKKINVVALFMFIFGVLAPMPILTVFSVSVYVWCILLCGSFILISWINSGIKASKNIEKSYIIIFIFTIISYLICKLRMPFSWKADLTTSFIQLLITFMFYVYFSSNNKSMLLKRFIDGVYISSIIQMIWGYFQLLFNSFGMDLNNMVFRDIFHFVSDTASQYQFGNLKVSGFCWNAGNLAPLVVFGYIYSENFVIKALFVLLALLSGSRTLVIGMVFCILAQVIYHLKKKKIKKNIFLAVVFSVFLVAIVILFRKNQIILLLEKIEYMFKFTKNISAEGSASTHLFYLTSIIDATKRNSILTNLFGYGPGCSGYLFSTFYGYYLDTGKWSVECDYVNRLWNYGYLGFAAYYFWLIKNIVIVSKIDIRCIFLFLTLLVQGFFYNTTLNWVSLLFVSIFIVMKNGKSGSLNRYGVDSAINTEK